MTGIKQSSVVLQERDKRILRELLVMKIIDRDQTKLVAGFGSTTRANTRLLKLTRAGLLKRLRLKLVSKNCKAVYAITKTGAAVVDGIDEAVENKPAQRLSGELFLEHQLGVNQIYLVLGHGKMPDPGTHFRSWRHFQAPLSTKVPLIPDGYFELETAQGLRQVFLEVDLGTEALLVWKSKVESYIQLAASGEFPRIFGGNQFRVLVVCSSDKRLRSLQSTIAGYTDKIFWLTTLDAIAQSSLWSPIWLRPQGTVRLTLL